MNTSTDGVSAMSAELGVNPGSEWTHRNGTKYTVICVANAYTERPDEYPVTIVYRGSNGRVWSRPLADWHRSMVPNTEAMRHAAKEER